MADNDFKGDVVPHNYEKKCPIVLVLDVSYSMDGEPLQELNKGLVAFQKATMQSNTAKKRVEVAVVSYGSKITVEHDFSHILDFEPPVLHPNGSTKLVDGMKKAFELVEERKKWYKATNQTYYRPIILLMTDGYPDSDQDIDWLKNEIERGSKSKNYKFWGLGVEGADMNFLNYIAYHSNDNGASSIFKLKDINFELFFEWLSASLDKIAGSREGDIIDVSPESEEKNPFMMTV